jgi:curved DNA-binding protein CbpA
VAFDPYQVLGVSPDASDAEIRTAYRRLVKQTHPDHNGGSPEAARRFEAVQAAYAQIQESRAAGTTAPRRSSPRPRPGPDPGPVDPAVEARLADLERQVQEAQKARDKAEQAARKAAREARAAAAGTERPTDEELGYVTTDDSLSKILTDAREELAGRFEHAKEHPVARRVRDLIDGLEDLAEGLDRPPRKRP